MRDLPAIAGSTYTASPVNLAAVNAVGAAGNFSLTSDNTAEAELYRRAQGVAQLFGQQATPQQEKQAMAHLATPTRRLVQVFIADPNENIPLEQSLLYSGEQKLTDATDQELFFEIDIKTILEKHNEKRVKVVDKKIKERTEYLEPAKIRDLKMVVVNVAGF